MKKTKTLNQLEQEYDLELDRIIEKIQEKKPRKILIQLPDALKPYAALISNYLQEHINQKTQISIWLGTCYGACDIPKTDADLVIQFGHAPWKS